MGMLVVETIAKIRRAVRQGKSIKAIARDLGLSRNTVRKAIRAPEAEFSYQRREQPRPRLDDYRERLDAFLAANAKANRRDRLRLSRIHGLLREQGYAGSYDAIRRYASQWRARQLETPADTSKLFIPLQFAPGEAYQFDWSHEDVEIAGVPQRVKVAHMRLCWSRAAFVRAYPRETQEMVMDAHIRGFAFFGGVPTRGIYDNMKTAVTTVFTGKERIFNRRFLLMTDHYGVEPTACTPAAGWEKGQVENQVDKTREGTFKPKLKFNSMAELNAFLEEDCRRKGQNSAHPALDGVTIAQALEQERSALQPLLLPFDGFFESDHVVSSTCLVSFDRNRYSVMARAGRQVVQLRAYADRIIIRHGGEVVGEHVRRFGRNQTVYDPWHYLPVLARKPGALRNGAPFVDWDLPPSLAALRAKLGKGDDADRQFVRILAMTPEHGLEAIEAAVGAALAAGVATGDGILNILARNREGPPPATLDISEALTLKHPPVADCARYDNIRVLHAAA